MSKNVDNATSRHNIENSNNIQEMDNNNKQLLIQSNKIPHPPPQSTRPTSTPARKLRLSSAVKNTQQKQSVSNPKETARIGIYKCVNFILEYMGA